MGCANYHAWLLFEDGDKWLVRIPRKRFCSDPDDLIEYLVASEYATLKFLETTKIPAPRTFGYGLGSDENNHVGVSYLLIEHLPGVPYEPDMFESDIQRQESFVGQVAQLLMEISQYPLPRAGSLLYHKNQIYVSQMASNRFFHLGLIGPFQTSLDYFVEISEQYLNLIADGQAHFQYPTEAFAFYTLARNEAKFFAIDDNSTTDKTPQFFLKHVDDKGDHLLVNEEGIITGIIDWQFARFAPAFEAFSPSYLTAELDWLYSDKTGITDGDRQLAGQLRKHGGGAIAAYMEKNEFSRRFHHGLGESVSKEEARKMLKAWLKTLGKECPLDMDAWIAELCGKDQRWGRVVCLKNDLHQLL